MDKPTLSPTSRWWYTHRTLRTIWASYRNLIKDHSLFTWHEDQYQTLETPPPPRTTSSLEGGPNRAIKELLRNHRGLTRPHAITAIDWLLNSLTEHPHQPAKLAQNHRTKPDHQPAADTQQASHYDTAIDLTSHDYHPGISIRKGTLK